MSGAGQPPRRTGEGRKPGDLAPDALIERMIRVDHAGEYGAVRIYQGQLAVLRGRRQRATLARIGTMARQEQRHLAAFESLVGVRRVRPTFLGPLWHVAGFALGAGTALLGEKAAMACTVAVEEVIDAHYARQAAALGDDETELRDTIERFAAEEREHRDTALDSGAMDAPLLPVLLGAVRTASRLAIWLSERI